MDSVFLRREDCCGCSACALACPVQAIAMRADSEGFLYPVIAGALCIDCAACTAVCPVLHAKDLKSSLTPAFYAVKHRENNVLMTSTSGGAFTALSDGALQRGGVVYGADFDEDLNVFHNRAETPAVRNRFKISKYVQSRMGKVFQTVAEDLAAGRFVLFTGTPCQCAGLRSFIGTKAGAEQLLLCDVLCYGVPSVRLWQDYLAWLSLRAGAPVNWVSFRNKNSPWSRGGSNSSFLYTVEGNPEKQSDSHFYSLFFDAKTILRPACHQCRFTSVNRPSDLTIADYWGIEKYEPRLMDERGVSVLLTNTEKGKAFFEEIRGAFEWEERPASESLNEQQRLSFPVPCPENRAAFWNDYNAYGFAFLME